jgi:hypothetical protein
VSHLRRDDTRLMQPCYLHRAIGRARECREERCAFWEDGVCTIEPLFPDLKDERKLAQLLLTLGRRIEASSVDASQVRVSLPPGLR